MHTPLSHPHPSHKLPHAKRRMLFQISSAEFATKGFNQASLNRIISQAGMSKSSFYHYFSNKNDLFFQTLNHALTPALERFEYLDINRLSADDFLPKIMQTVTDLTEMASETPEMVTSMRMFYRCYDDPESRAIAAEVLGDFMAWIAQAIAHGQALGVVRRDLPQTMLIDVLMAVGMSIDRWMVSHWDTLAPAKRVEVGQAAFGIFIRLFAPEKPADTE